MPCPQYTFQDEPGSGGPCKPCTAGYFCNDTAIVTVAAYPCAAGRYWSPFSKVLPFADIYPPFRSPLGTQFQLICPSGTYRASTGAANLTDCTPCPQGYFCKNGLHASFQFFLTLLVLQPRGRRCRARGQPIVRAATRNQMTVRVTSFPFFPPLTQSFRRRVLLPSHVYQAYHLPSWVRLFFIFFAFHCLFSRHYCPGASADFPLHGPIPCPGWRFRFSILCSKFWSNQLGRIVRFGLDCRHCVPWGCEQRTRLTTARALQSPAATARPAPSASTLTASAAIFALVFCFWIVSD